MKFKPGKYFSPGKLLISGEYAVLNGAEALAIPTKFGQTLEVNIVEDQALSWNSYDHKGNRRFSSVWSQDGKAISSSDDSWNGIIEKTLGFLIRNKVDLRGVELEFRLDYPAEWGLGSSSTLAACIAKSVGIDAMQLFQNSQTGSGYDVAVAMEESAILYRLEDTEPKWRKVKFEPDYIDRLYFVFLGQKQSSEKEVKRFEKRPAPKKGDIEGISEITSAFLSINSLKDFQSLTRRHEEIISSLISRTPVGQLLFQDFAGSVKSLGAWGGDFILAAADDGADAEEYFQRKGFEVVFDYTELVSE